MLTLVSSVPALQQKSYCLQPNNNVRGERGKKNNTKDFSSIVRNLVSVQAREQAGCISCGKYFSTVLLCFVLALLLSVMP